MIRPPNPVLLLLIAFLALTSAINFVLIGCSSGLGGKVASAATGPSERSTNLRFGFDPGGELTAKITDFDITGGVLPAIGDSGERPVAFFTFVTKTSGNNFDPEVTDNNVDSDIFTAVVDSTEIDPRAFVYALAGSFRHPRCTTCHQMNVVADPTDSDLLEPTAFATQSHPRGGNPPLNDTSDVSCKDCHFISGWRAPSAGFDLRPLSTRELFERAQRPPKGLREHFTKDLGVLWALGSGRTPFDNAADDDHDGIAEPEDSDGIIRTVPGGVDGFQDRLQRWMETRPTSKDELKFDSAGDAVQDIILVSQNLMGNAGAGGSSAPSTVYVENPAFNPGVSDPDVVPIGFIRIAFASNAIDMMGGGTNGSADIFRATIGVHVTDEDKTDLRYISQIYVSKDSGGGDANGASTDPDIGGDAGDKIAFVSAATDLVPGFPDTNGPTLLDVYLYDSGTTSLVSHLPGSLNAGGDRGSYQPDLSPSGDGVAFESDATNLVMGDTNGVRDVFYALQPFVDLMRASVAEDGDEGVGGDSRHGSIYVFAGGPGVRVAFESDKKNLTARLPALTTTNVFLRDTRGRGTTLLLNQMVSRTGTRLPSATDVDGTRLGADAKNPVISPYGNAVLFETTAQDLDFVRSSNFNRTSDVVLVDLLQVDAQGLILPYTVSVTADGGDANGPSGSPRFGGFTPKTDAFPLGIAVFNTMATNLGNSDPGIPIEKDDPFNNQMILFLREGATVVADFEADPVRQGMGLEVQFQDRSSGKPTSFLWDFGDGSPTSTERNPTHVYASPDNYTVSLEVSGELGQDDRTRTKYVAILGPVEAKFTSAKDDSFAPDQGGPDPVSDGMRAIGAIDVETSGSRLFFDLNSTPSTQFPDKFEWSLAMVDQAGNPHGPPEPPFSTDPTTRLEIDKVGFYDLSLKATGPGGTGEATQRIEVYRSVKASPEATSMSVGPTPLTVQFMANPSEQSDLRDTAPFEWRFKPAGSTTMGTIFSTEENPSNEFTAGVFEVTLTVFGKGGDSFTTTPDLTVVSAAGLEAVFRAAPTTTPSVQGRDAEAIDSGAGVSVQFTNFSVVPGAPLFYHWDFGNGMTSTEKHPTVLFSLSNPEQTQEFNVKLIASTTDPAPTSCVGIPSTQCKEFTGTLKLYPKPTVNFGFGSSFSPSYPPPFQEFITRRPPHTVTFTSQVTGVGVGTEPSYKWFRSSEPGGENANTSFEFDVLSTSTFHFPDPGDYKVQLVVETNGPGMKQRVQSVPNTVTVTAATFTQFFNQAIQPFGQPGCSTSKCHDSSDPAANLDWSGPATEAWARIVNADANCNPNFTLIKPGDPDNSVVYDALTLLPQLCIMVDPNVQPMRDLLPSLPFPGTDEGEHVEVLRSWILGGAKNN